MFANNWLLLLLLPVYFYKKHLQKIGCCYCYCCCCDGRTTATAAAAAAAAAVPTKTRPCRTGNTMALKDEWSPKYAFPEAGTSLLKSPTRLQRTHLKALSKDLQSTHGGIQNKTHLSYRDSRQKSRIIGRPRQRSCNLYRGTGTKRKSRRHLWCSVTWVYPPDGDD